MPAPRPAPTVSVALCTYQGARYVREQLASILTQSAPVTEVVVGDDGSSDTTVAAIEEVAATHGASDRVRIAFTARVGGIVPNMERTLRECSGEFIALADQDDVWHPDRVAVALARFAARPELLMVAGNARLIDGEGGLTGPTLHEQLAISPRERAALDAGDALSVFIRRNLVTGATAMIRPELRDLAAPLPSTWVHDEWLAVIAAGLGRLELLPEPVIDYRVHGANQIGVTAPTLTHKLRQVAAPRGDRLERLAARAESLADRAPALGFPADAVGLVEAKLAFERRRASYPASRWKRLSGVMRALRSGEYRALASQGQLDALRDLAQPASRRR